MSGRRRQPETGMVLALVVATSVVVALAVRTSVYLLLAPVPLAALAGVAWWLARGTAARRRSRLGSAFGLPAGYRWIPLAWLVFAFVSTQKLSQRSVEAASSGSPSLENLVEVGFYALMVVVMVLRWPRATDRRPGPFPVVLFAWPAWALLTTLWSLIPLFTLVRGTELVVVAAFALFSARALDLADDDGSGLAQPFLQMFTNLATALALFAFAWPYQYPDLLVTGTGTTPTDGSAPAVSSIGDRLSWYGVHPLVAAEILGSAALVLMVAGPRLLRMSFVGWGVRLAILCAATGRTQGRSVIIGFVVAALIAVYVRTRGRPLHRYLAVTYYLGACTVALVVFWQQLLEAATRGEGTQRLLNLNGRLPLWQLALREIRTVGETFIGLGLGSSRATLSKEVGFAGQSHNSVIETILGTGVIGLVLWLAWLGWLVHRSRARRLPRPLPKPFTAAFSALLTLLLILGLISPELASPGYSYSLLGLLAVFVLQRPEERGTAGRDGTASAFPSVDSTGRRRLVPA